MNNGACLTIWFRYVDDTFTLFQVTAVQFLSYLNSQHKNIHWFAIEFEHDPEIPLISWCSHQTST